MRCVKLLLPLSLLIALPAAGQNRLFQTRNPPQGQLDSNESIFAVLAAINVAGYDVDSESPTNHPLRKQLRDFLKAKDLKSVDALGRFVRAHRSANPRADLSQYISYALTTNGPPDFSYRYASGAIPTDVDALEGLTPLMIEFTREANIDELWKRVQPAYDAAIAQYQEPVARAVLQANAYLRNDTAGYLGRRFQIYIDLLGAPNQVQTRSYVDDYFIVLTPVANLGTKDLNQADLPVEEIRHMYLHYLLDALPMKYSDTVNEKRALADYALGSPILEAQYKTDFMLLTTECLIKAVESRIDRKPAMVEQALREGFVMTPAFAERLEVYEKQEQSMRLNFRELVEGIDLKREEKRLDHIDFASANAVRRARVVTREETKPPELTGVAKTLDEADKAYRDKDLARAKEIYLRSLKETDQKPLHAKAYYGLARIAALERDPEKADQLFRVVLEQDPDAETKSWSLLYLGRLADSQGWREEAVKHYEAALAVAGVPETVREAAVKGLEAAPGKKKN